MTPEEAIDLTVEIRDKLSNTDFDNVAVLAGGAARDIYLGREVKDLDFYVHYRDRGSINRALQSIWPETYRRITGQYHNRTAINILDGKAQFFFLSEPPEVEIARSFDIGLCMCFFNMGGQFYSNEAFDSDVDNRQITIYPRHEMTSHQIGRSFKDHLPRVIAKYPDWEVKVHIEMSKRFNIADWRIHGGD